MTDRQRLESAMRQWREEVAILPDRPRFSFFPQEAEGSIRSVELKPPATESAITNWEATHAYNLPFGLKKWLRISDGLMVNGVRWIHPLRCIGPTVRFQPGGVLLQQPASWYEFGNPYDAPVNMDLLVTPEDSDGRTPVFVSISDADDSFRVIADHFTEWFERVVAASFGPFWNSGDLASNPDPVELHYASLQPPKLSPKLCKICVSVGDALSNGEDERELMKTHEINRTELEQIISAYQYRRQKSISR
jgi:hypothetical protein